MKLNYRLMDCKNNRAIKNPPSLRLAGLKILLLIKEVAEKDSAQLRFKEVQKVIKSLLFNSNL